MDELEKAKLLSVATKLAKAEVEEVRSQLIEQINSIQIPEVKDGRDGRSITDARIFEGQLVLQLSDSTLVTVGTVIGEQGPVGPIGAKGDKGDKGDTGEQGVPGPRGDTGPQGLAGKDGERGPRGDKGDKGDPGLKGDKGDQGERGEQGEQGIAGERGERGERGEQGPSGIDGTNGRDGSDGAKGETGERGPQGVPGRDGKDGKDGAVGQKGDKGDKGNKGDKGDPGSDADVTKLEKKLDQFTQDVDKRISKVAFNATMAGSSSGSGEVLLYRLDDVDYNTVKTPGDGQGLVWNESIKKWQASDIAATGNTGTITVGKVLANGAFVDTISSISGLRFDDDSGFDVVDLGNGNAKIQMNSTFKYWNVDGASGLTAVGLDTANFIAGSGITISANPANNSITFTSTGGGGGLSNTFTTTVATRALIPTTDLTYNIGSPSRRYNDIFLSNSSIYVGTVKLSVSKTNFLINDKPVASNVYVTSTFIANTTARSLINEKISVANAKSYMQVANTKAYLANTNAYIASKVNTTTFNSALANTNAFIKTQLANTNAYIASRATWNALTSTNTALRTLISDRLQVANAINTYQTIATERAALANTNSFIKSQLANTNSFIKAQLANTNARFPAYLQVSNADLKFATKAYAAANSYVNSTLANTNAYIGSKVNTTTFNSALANTNAYIATKISNTVSTTIQTRNIIPEADITYNLGSPSRRFKTLYISGNTIALGTANLSSTGSTLKVGGQTLATNAYLTSTYIANTTARTLISDRMQVANVNTNFFKKTGIVAQTVTPLTTFSANVSIEGKLFVTGGIQTYSANNLSIGDNMIYLNSGNITDNPDLGFAGNYNDGTYHHTGFFRDASDNGTWKVFENYAPEPDANVYINTSHATFRLAPFSAQNITVARNLTVVANSTLGNTSVSGFLKLNGTDIRATFAQNTYVKSTLANTNAYIATKASWVSVTGTNTALRTLISDRLQVANANALYPTKVYAASNVYVNNTFLNKTGLRSQSQSVNTNVSFAANVAITGDLIITGTEYDKGLVINGNRGNIYLGNDTRDARTIVVTNSLTGYYSGFQVRRAGADLWYTGAHPNETYILRSGANNDVMIANNTSGVKFTGNVRLAAGVIANNSLGSAGYVLKTNGSTVYWSADVSGGGGGGGGGSATVTSKTVKDLVQTDTVITSVDGLLYSSANVVTKSLDSIKGSDQVVTSVNGMLVALPTYLQVANAVSTYTTKSNPTTSGLHAHTGRATVSTNLAVSGNTALGGLLNINYTGSANAAVVIQGIDTKGGAGYHDFLMARNGGGGTNPNKWFRINSTGALEIVNSAYSAVPLSLTDAGDLAVTGTVSTTNVYVNNKLAVNGPAFSAYASAVTTIPTDVLTKVNFATEEYDTNNNFASSRFTPTVAGYYQLNSTVRMSGSSGTGEMMIVVYKNGSEYHRGWNSQGQQIGSGWWSMSVNTMVYANGTGDYFEIYVQQGSAANRDTTSGSTITWFNGCMVRGA